MGKKQSGLMASLGEIKMSKLATPTAILILLIVVIYWATSPSEKPMGAVMETIENEHVFQVK